MANTYDAPRIRDLKRDEIAGTIQAGPWKPPQGWWTVPSWRHWRRFSVIELSITEAYTESWIVESGPDYSAGPRDRSETKMVKEYSFSATVPISEFWRGDPDDRPAGKSLWFHDSKTAWGEGLYYANGQLIVYGTAVKRERTYHIFTPAGGGTDENLTTDVPTTDTNANVSTSYNSDETAINGLATPCRMVVDQVFNPPGAAFWDNGLLFPSPLDPDGNPGGEKYWTDTALAVLAAGSWASEMQLTEGSLTEMKGPNLGGIDNGDFWLHTFERSGTLALTIG
ncbi:MAG: hypothetical protein EON58_04030 [Alphaproteobacteria bacterium]|nr:MAG: hypothetical protein EON58_04030 [Alphaproteobacteria bacterium]